MTKFRFKLYITGRSPRSESALLNLRRVCDEELPGQYEVSIIDVLEQPDVAEQEKIIATPTLVKEYPPPARRIIGDLADAEQLMACLGLHAKTIERGAAANSKESKNAK